jgi:phenylacetate-CoA ligase
MKKTITQNKHFRRAAEWLYFKASGSLRYDYWKMLEKTQYLSIDQLRSIQRRRLRNMMDYVYHNNYFYRQRFDSAGIRPADIREPRDLKKLPVLTKAQVRQNADKLLSRNAGVNHLFKLKTGGSTGKALEFFISEPCSELRNALARRHDRWSGWEIGEPVAAIWGNPVYPKGFKETVVNWIVSPNIYLDTMSVTDDSVRAFVGQWEKVGPTLIFGHAHSIFLLSQYLDRLNLRHLRPKGIISSSMMLLPHERHLIERIFHTKVTNRYGCEEVSLIASECEQHSGMHVNMEHLVVEVLRDNGSDAAPGELGHIVVTDLMNRAMPFIRYRVEDMGIMSVRSCPCGRELPLMDHVAGRVADFLIREDGSQVSGISLIENTLTRIPGLDQMQIIQESREHVVLNLAVSIEFTENKKKELLDYFKSIFGFHAIIDLNSVERIMPEPSGKYRFSICRIPNPK